MLQIQLFVAVLLVAAYTESNELEDFVRLKMTNYSTWLKNNELDPSPVQAGPDLIIAEHPYHNIDWKFRNHHVKGHSDGIEIGQVWGDLGENVFDIQWAAEGNVTFYGEYSANGTVGSPAKPISGEGVFLISTAFVRQTFNYIYFNETPSGYLAVRKVAVQGIAINFDDRKIYFENFFENEAAAGWVISIKLAMFNALKDYLNLYPENPYHPLRTSYVQYWEQVLSQTTLADIVGPGTT